MGFGLIFLGYIFTVFDMGFIVNEALSVFVCKILCVGGYAVLICGLSKYSKYSAGAKRSLFAFIALAALQAGDGVIQGLWHFGAIGSQIMANIRVFMFPAIAALYAVSHILLYLAIRQTASETECPKVFKKAVSSVALTGAFCVINMATALPFDLGDPVNIIRYVLFIVVTAVNAVTLYSAYMWICLDTDLEKERIEMAKWKKK